MLRTFTMKQIADRKVELIELPDEIAVKQKSLDALRQNMLVLVEERDLRNREHIVPMKEKIRAAEARMEAIDLPGQIAKLKVKIDTQESVLRALRRGKDHLEAQINPKELNLAKLKKAEQVYKARIVVAECEATLTIEKAAINNCDSLISDLEAKLHLLETKVDKIESEIGSVKGDLAAARIKRSAAIARRNAAEESMADNKQVIIQNSLNLLGWYFLDMSSLAEVRANIVQETFLLAPLLSSREQFIKDIETHEAKLNRLIAKRTGKDQTLVRALQDQVRYQDLTKAQAEEMLQQHREEIAPYNQAQNVTLLNIRELQANIDNRQHYINRKQALLDDHLSNQFLIAFEENPLSLLLTLRQSLITALQAFDKNHQKLDCKEARRTLCEYLSRVECIVGDEADLLKENLLQHRARLDCLTGYVWSLIKRPYADKYIAAVLESSFNRAARAEAESVSFYMQCVNENPAQLGPYTDALLANKEDDDYTAARNVLVAALVHMSQNKTEQKLYAACRDLLESVDSIEDNKAYRAKLLIAIHALLIDYANPENHRRLAELAKLNTHGESSLTKIISGGALVVLGVAGGLLRALDEASDSFFKPVALACVVALSGGILILSGLTKGLKLSLQTFEVAAQNAQKDPALQNYGVFRAPAAAAVYQPGSAPSAPSIDM